MKRGNCEKEGNLTENYRQRVLGIVQLLSEWGFSNVLELPRIVNQDCKDCNASEIVSERRA